MATSFQCPNCSGPIAFEGHAVSVQCPYCGTTVVVPEELRSTETGSSNVQVFDLSEIMSELQSGRKINAIKLYRELTNLGLKEAKDAVEQMEASGWTTTSSQRSTINIQMGSAVTPDMPAAQPSRANVPLLIGILAVFMLAIIGAAAFLLTMETPISSVLLAPTETFVPSPTPFGQAGLAFGDEGSGPGYFKDARSVAVDAKGRIYVGDYIPGRIQAFAPDGTFLWQYLTPGDTDYVISLAAGLDGRLYAVVGRNIQVFDAENGKPLAKWEPEGQMIGYYNAIAVSPKGEIVAVMERELAKYDSSGKVLLRVGGMDEDFLKKVGVKDGSPRITGMAVDGSGNIYVGTSENFILKLAEDGTLIDRLNGEGDGGVDAIAIDGQGRIAWSYAGRIVITDNAGRTQGEFDAPYMRDVEFNFKGQLVAVKLSAPIIQIYNFGE